MKLRRETTILGTIFLLVVGLAGCSGDETETAVAAPAKGPDEAVVRLAQGLADGRPEVAWRALPPSYRQDVNELVQLAATKMDEDVWNQSFGLVQKLTRLAREKKEFILEQPMLAQGGGDKQELEAGWDAVAGILDTLANSELSDLDRLAKIDVEEFLAGTGGEIMQQLASASALAPDDSWDEQMSRLQRTSATVVSESGKTAVVRVERPGLPPVEEEYAKVEGHWIPKKIADTWSGEVNKARQQIEQMSTETMAQNKQSILMQLSMVEAALDQLLQTENREEFNAALGPIMGMAMGAMMAQAANSAPIQSNPQIGSPLDHGSQAPQIEFPDTLMEPTTEPSPVTATHTRLGRQTTYAATGSHELHEPGVVSFDKAHLYVGQFLNVNTTSGMSTVSRLKEARDDVLVFERYLHGGSATFEVAQEEIDTLRVAER